MEQRINRALSVSELYKKKFRTMPFTGEWLDLFGEPELSGCWLVWGESANGKTSFMMQLCKYLSQFGRVAYDSLEEGISESLKKAIDRANMMEVERRFIILHKEPIEELENRLNRRKSPDIVVIDSVQYTDLNKRTAKAFVDRHPRKLLIFVSHAQGKMPEGRTANAIRFDANVKIRVEGYRASIESRYGGDKSRNHTIWHEGAAEYWGD